MPFRKTAPRLAVLELERRDVPTFLGNQIFPLDNPWNQRITDAPVASNSADIIGHLVSRGNARVHPDFGNPTIDPALWGIPINVVDNSTPLHNVYLPSGAGGIGYPHEADIVPVPIPADAVIEGDGPSGPEPSTNRRDSHMLLYNRDTNVLYELYQAIRPGETAFPYGGVKPNTTQWGAWHIAQWDLNANTFRRVGWTSSDAAGLPIMPGLVRPDEALPVAESGQGIITHAIRFTVQQTRNDFVYPASHKASWSAGLHLPRMGERFRLRASFEIPSNWTPEAKAVAQAMKDYGLIVADNGSDMYFQGVPSGEWDMPGMLAIQNALRASDFEVVDLTPRVTSLSVTSGVPAGGTVVTITGQNFSGAAGRLSVLFGTTPAASFTIVSDTRIDAVAPAGSAGTVSVRVQSGRNEVNSSNQTVFFGYGTSADTPADDFTYSSTSPPPPPAAGALQLTQSSVSVNEGAGTVTFTVSRTGGSAGAVSVQFATSNGTASWPADYAAASGTLTWADGDATPKTVTVSIAEDAADEPNESFSLTLSNATGGAALGGTNQTIATIVDNDGPASPPPLPPPPPPPPVPLPIPLAPTGAPFAVGTDRGTVATVTQYTPDGTVRWTLKPFGDFLGGVRVSSGDVNGDGVPDVVAGTGPGVATRVRVFDGRDGSPLFDVAPFEAAFVGGVYVATGDLTGDGRAEFVVTPDEGGGPRVQVYSGDFSRLADFFGIDDPNFRGGARAAVGDVNGDGRGDLLVSAGFQGGPRVAGYDGTTLATDRAKLFPDFFAFEESVRNGVFLASGDLDGDGFSELITGGGPGGGPRVSAFGGRQLFEDKQPVRKGDFFAGDASNRGGVRVAVANLDGDGRADLLVGSGSGGGSRVTAFRGMDVTPTLSFDAAAGFGGGVFVG